MSPTFLLVLGVLATAALLALATDALKGTVAPPGESRPTIRQARIVCPELGNLKRVWLDTSPDGAPSVVRCDRFGHREVTCARSCLIPVSTAAA